MATTTRESPADSGKVLKIKALDTFMHGRLQMAAGDTETIESGEARELEKAGLVSIETESKSEDVDDLLGDGEKMDDEPKNKMDKTPVNKTVTHSKVK